MRNSKEQQSLKPSTLRAAVFVLLVMLIPVEQAQAQGPPTGPAGGDLSGTYPNPVLATDRVRKTGDTMTGALTITIPALQSQAVTFQRGHNQVGAMISQHFTLNNSNNNPFLYAGLSGSIVNSTAGSEGGALRFFTFGGAGGFTERAVIDNFGNFGVGTSGPSDVLHISKSQNGFTALRVDNPDALGNSASSGIRFYQGGTLRGQLTTINDGFTAGVGGPGALQLWNPLNAT